MDRTKPYQVDGKTHLLMMNADDGLPAAFALMGTRAAQKTAIRITGGCKGMDAVDKQSMIDFFERAMAGFSGVAFTGGTRMVDKDGLIDPMVTDVAGVIARTNPGAVALGTIPRTEIMTLQGDSRLVLDQWGTVPNPAMQGILIVQNGPDGNMEWDGDLETYFRIMENWKNYAEFDPVGLISWNGGEITRKEIMGSLKRCWPTILIKGSGRVTDELIGKIDSADGEVIKSIPDISVLHIIEKTRPDILSAVLKDLRFLR